MPYTLSNGTSVKTAGKNTLFHFTVLFDQGPLAKGNIIDTIDELVNELKNKCTVERPLVVLSIEGGLSRDDYLRISQVLTNCIVRSQHKINIILSPSDPKIVSTNRLQKLDNAHRFIQNLFQNDKTMAKMIRQYSSGLSSSPVDVKKDQLIEMLLKLVESQGIELDEQGIMDIAAEFRSLKEVAEAVMKYQSPMAYGEN